MVWDKTKVVERGNHKVSRTPDLSACVSLHISPITRLLEHCTAPTILLRSKLSSSYSYSPRSFLDNNFLLVYTGCNFDIIWWGTLYQLCREYSWSGTKPYSKSISGLTFHHILVFISFPTGVGSLGLWEKSCTRTAGKTPRNHYFTSFLVYQKQKSIFQPKSI